jgi:checkpoint serine/threonine-protein kinase
MLPAEGGEYSMPEVRARAIGLLGKKWAPPTPPFKPIPQPKAARSPSPPPRHLQADVNFNDDGAKSSRGFLARRSIGFAEPTVTINTKAALEDVFGMYNSPDRTVRFGPGTKYAATRPIEHASPPPPIPAPAFAPANENAGVARTPGESYHPYIPLFILMRSAGGFKPFVDENAGRKDNVAPAKVSIRANHVNTL